MKHGEMPTAANTGFFEALFRPVDKRQRDWGMQEVKNRMGGVQKTQPYNQGGLQPDGSISEGDLFPGEMPIPGLKTITQEATGLLGGQISPAEFATGLLSTPGYQPLGAELYKTMIKPAEPVKYKDVEYGLPGGMRTKGFINPLNPNAAPIPFGSPYAKQSLVSIQKDRGKPLGASAANWTNKDGEQPSATNDVYDAVGRGYRPMSVEQRKALLSAKNLSPTIGSMFAQGFGKDGEASLFPPEDAGLTSRAISGASTYLSTLTRSNERASLYDINKKAMLAGIARVVGHTGVLTEQDIETIRGLLPIPGFTPDSLARQNFKQIVNLMEGRGVADFVLRKAGFPEWAISKNNDNVNITDLPEN